MSGVVWCGLARSGWVAAICAALVVARVEGRGRGRGRGQVQARNVVALGLGRGRFIFTYSDVSRFFPQTRSAEELHQL